MSNSQTVVRRLIGDFNGDLPAAIRYAERIALTASRNPYAESGMSQEYAQAAEILKGKLSEKREATAVQLLEDVLNRWSKDIKNDEPINGSDAVEWLVSFVHDIKKLLKK